MAELQEIFQKYGAEYCRRHKISPEQGKAMRAITACRTAQLGGHMDTCPACGYEKPSYNSCRNRHCPKCQSLVKERWIEHQKYDLLNVGYFHVVFTVPAELNQLIYQKQRTLYNLMFRTVAETMAELSADKKYLGAAIGFTSVLHTWGQNLMHHPHIHCIVPSGGLTKDGKWLNSRKKFFLPVKVLSRKFRGKFLALLQQEKLEFHGQLAHLSDPAAFQQLCGACYRKEWVVYCKPPFRDAACVVEYLGRYTHRVAISNNRILSAQGGAVSFKWRDYKDGSHCKEMTLSALEFMRRFLIHVLPTGFTKIRHYGFLSNRNRTERLQHCKILTNTPIRERQELSTLELLQRLTGRDISKCPDCGASRIQHASLSPPIPA